VWSTLFQVRSFFLKGLHPVEGGKTVGKASLRKNFQCGGEGRSPVMGKESGYKRLIGKRKDHWGPGPRATGQPHTRTTRRSSRPIGKSPNYKSGWNLITGLKNVCELQDQLENMVARLNHLGVMENGRNSKKP